MDQFSYHTEHHSDFYYFFTISSVFILISILCLGTVYGNSKYKALCSKKNKLEDAQAKIKNIRSHYQVNKKSNNLLKKRNFGQFTKVLKCLSSTIPATVHLNTVSYNPSTLIISATAQSVDGLHEFLKNVGDNQCLKKYQVKKVKQSKDGALILFTMLIQTKH